jgi:hypothetical protein
MLFATATMAARIERAERQTVQDFADQAAGADGAVIAESIGGGIAVHGGPGQPYQDRRTRVQQEVR